MSPETMRWSKGSDIENERVATNNRKWFAAKGTARPRGNAPVVFRIIVLNGPVAQVGETSLVGPRNHRFAVGRRAYFKPQVSRPNGFTASEAAASHF